MTATRDPDRLIRAYLAEGRTELSTEAYDAVRSDIERTRQRAIIGPWREPAMPTIARFGVAVAAVLIVGIVGLNLSGGSGIGPAVPSPSPSATTIPPSATPSEAAYTWPGALAAGTYTTSLVWDVPFTTTFAVPAGWQGMDIELSKGPVFVSFQIVDNVYTDPCAKTPLDPPVGPSVSDLADALTSVEGFVPVKSEVVSFGGAPGRYLELEAKADTACPVDEHMSLWREMASMAKSGQPYGGPDGFVRYPHHRIWILDVAGLRYVIDTAHSDDASAADLAELQQVLDSISIWQPAPTTDCTVSLVDWATQTERVGSPYVATLGASAEGMLGPVPDPLPSFPQPVARMDFRTAGAGSGVRLTRPDGTVTSPAYDVTDSNFQGTMFFDAPGTWLAEFDGLKAGCPHIFLIDVRAP
jgi:hypothetical protein